MPAQACEQAYLETLAAHGIPKPQLPQSPAQQRSNGSSSSETGSLDVPAAGGSSSGSADSAAAYSLLLQRLGSGAAAGAGSLEFVGSPAGSHVRISFECLCGHYSLAFPTPQCVTCSQQQQSVFYAVQLCLMLL
jgi:hypothetical protein